MPARSAGLGFPLGPGGAESPPCREWAGGQGHSGPSRSVTRACLCSSPDVSPAPPSLRTGPSRGAVPPAATSGRGAVTAQPRGEGSKEERQRRAPAPPPCAAHHVSVRGAARTRAPRGEMVALPSAGPEAEAGTAELHVQTRPETALLAPGGPLLPPAPWRPQAPQPGGMEACEQGKCAGAAGPASPQQAGGGCSVIWAEVVLRGLSPSTDAVGRRVGGGAGLVGGHVGCGQVTGKARHSRPALSSCIPAMSVLCF